ncbi:MAG: hypothetical protein H0U49_00015 [Parachlamydiaceae bacterium]|nr:hypothetical protein [Parachlamydiaceae bacterium]
MTSINPTQFSEQPFLANSTSSVHQPKAVSAKTARSMSGAKTAIAEVSAQTDVIPKVKWNELAIRKLNQFETDVVDKIPNILNTDLLDSVCDKAGSILNLLMSKLKPLKKFNAWLDTNELQQPWESKLKQLAVFLAKLPARAVRNVITMIVNLIKAAVYATIHPAKAAVQLAKLIVKMAEELTKPESWSKIGVGIIGASLGHAAVGNPLSIISLIIGTVITAGGLTTGAVLAALKEENSHQKLKAAGQELLKHAQLLPEAMLTSFCIGLLVGGFQKLTSSTGNPVDETVNAYIKKHNLVKPDYVQTDSNLIYSLGKDELRLRWRNFDPNVNAISDRGLAWREWAHVKTIPYNPNPSVTPSLLATGILTSGILETASKE